MPQNPVDTTLFVSKIVAGDNITISPDSGTGIITINGHSPFDTTTIGSLTVTQLMTVTGNAVLGTTQVSGLTATNVVLSTTQVGGLTATSLAVSGNTALHTTQVGSLAATQVVGATTYVANGATGVTIQLGGLTASCTLQFGLKTVGGTVGNTPHAIFPPNTGAGTVVIAATALDTSTYNVNAIG